MKDIPNIIDWEKRKEERFYGDRKTITNYLKSQLGDRLLNDNVIRSLIKKNEDRKFVK